MNWLRRSLTRNFSKIKNPDPQSRLNREGEDEEPLYGYTDEEQLYGITEDLINHIKSFTIDTFKNFRLDEDETTNAEKSQVTSAKVRTDLSEWQERHAILILSRVKELSQLRYKLCPGRLKEEQFWSIYFKLVRSHVIEYELRAVQREKLKKMASGQEKSSDNSAFEVEMAEKRQVVSGEPPPL